MTFIPMSYEQVFSYLTAIGGILRSNGGILRSTPFDHKGNGYSAIQELIVSIENEPENDFK